VLAGGLIEVDDSADPEKLFDDLLGRLKEFDLKRRIAAGKARMKEAESVKDKAQRDEIYLEVSALALELEALQRGRPL
jgi:hypothetical protein